MSLDVAGQPGRERKASGTAGIAGRHGMSHDVA